MRISDWSSDVCSSDLRADFLQPKPVASDGDDGAARFRRVAEAPVRPRDPVAELDLALGIAGEAGRADQARRAVGAAEDEEACLVGPSLRIEEGERQEIGRAHV